MDTELSEFLKSFRVDIDKNIQKATGANKNLYKGNREMAIVRTKLQEAKMWLGKVMEENDSPLPQEFRDEFKG